VRTTAGTRRRNARGEGARLADDIVAGAQAIIERTGNDEGVTLRSVAREVGIAAPSIYAHFADREAILWGVVRKVFEELRVQVEAATVGWDDPVDRLVAGCEAYVAFGLDHPSLYRALYARQFPSGAAGAVPDRSVGPTILLDDRFPPVGGEAFALLVDAIERCMAAGRSTSVDPFDDATAVWVALHGMVSLWSTVCDFPWPEGQHQFVRRLVLPLARVRPPQQ
jgi:AcrR family transcriptional regulator